MRKTEEDQGAKLVQAMAGVLLGGVLALAVCLVFLFFCSIGISGGWLDEGLMYQMTVVGCVIGGFAGAVAAVRKSGSRALIVGLLTGGVFFLLLLTAQSAGPWKMLERKPIRSVIIRSVYATPQQLQETQNMDSARQRNTRYSINGGLSTKRTSVYVVAVDITKFT